jgi:signal transduction histidine kinase
MRMPGLGRFHGFLLASGALIGVVIAVSGLSVGRFYERNVLAHEEEYTANVVRAYAAQSVSPADFELTLPGVDRPAFKNLLQELSASGVFRIKVYDRTGRIVWSDEPRLLGRVFPDHRYLEQALRGKVVTVLQPPQQPENIYERTRGYVAETYVPIGSAVIVGVIETYKDATQVVLNIRRTQRLTWGLAGGMGLFLYGSLAFIVWTASSNERRAISRLAEAHAALLAKTEELERANAALREAQARLVEKERLAAVGEVVVGLHHGVLNPLTGILGALQVLKQEEITPEKAEALAQAEAEIRQIEQLIRRLPTLRRAAGTVYVGDTTMLDLQRSNAEEEQG